MDLNKIFFGTIALSIGIIILYNNKTLVKMAIESQKGVDRAFGKERTYNGVGFTLIPKVVILVIGVSFSMFGAIAILTNFL